MIGPGVLDDHVLGVSGAEGGGVGARGARVVMPRRLRWLGGCSSRRGTLLLLGLVASADPVAVVIATGASSTTTATATAAAPDEAAAAA